MTEDTLLRIITHVTPNAGDPSESMEDANGSLERVLNDITLNQSSTTEHTFASPTIRQTDTEREAIYTQLIEVAKQVFTWAKNHPHHIAYFGLIGEVSTLPARFGQPSVPVSKLSIESSLPTYLVHREKVHTSPTLCLNPGRLKVFWGAPLEFIPTDRIMTAAYLDFVHYEAQNFLSHNATGPLRTVAAKYNKTVATLPPLDEHAMEQAQLLTTIFSQSPYQPNTGQRITQTADLQTLKKYKPLLNPFLKYNLQ